MHKGTGVKHDHPRSKGSRIQACLHHGLEEGLFPHERLGAHAPQEEMEEERRLYVALRGRRRNPLPMPSAGLSLAHGGKHGFIF